MNRVKFWPCGLVWILGALLVMASVDTIPDPPASHSTTVHSAARLHHRVLQQRDTADRQIFAGIVLPLVRPHRVAQTIEPSYSNPVIRAIDQMANVSPPLA
jgi:hypothetical protein